MADVIDTYRAAKLCIDQHGDQAALQAAMRSDALLAAGDIGAALEDTPLCSLDGTTAGFFEQVARLVACLVLALGYP